MGVYTGLAKLGAARWEARGYAGTGPARSNDDSSPITETRFICPECREQFAFPEDCARCKRPVVDRTLALPTAPPMTHAAAGPMKFSFGMLAVGVLGVALPAAWVPVVELFEGSDTGLVVTVIAVAATLAIVVPTAIWGLGSAKEKIAARRGRRALREAATALPTRTMKELPEETTEPVRFEGRLRLETTPTHVRVRIADETGTAILPEGASVHAWSADSSLEEITAVHDGDLVEVVALGRRVSHADVDGYRGTDREFELDASAPIRMWVRRKS